MSQESGSTPNAGQNPASLNGTVQKPCGYCGHAQQQFKPVPQNATRQFALGAASFISLFAVLLHFGPRIAELYSEIAGAMAGPQREQANDVPAS